MALARTVLYVNHVGLISGAERSLLAVVARLDRSRFRPVLACPGGPLARRARSLGVATAEIPSLRLRRARCPVRLLAQGSRWAGVVAALVWIARTERAALIHANSTTAALAAAFVARVRRTPCVWHVRDLAPLGCSGRALAPLCDRAIAISDAVARPLADVVQASRLRTIHNGIDAPGFARGASRERGRRALGLSPGHRVVATIGQFVPWKRHGDFIGAFARVAEEMPSARAVVVGADMFGEHPGERGRLEALCRELGIADRVVFTGYRDDVQDILAASDVFAMASVAEPFGRAALEAQAMGLPVVGTRAGGLPEVVEDKVSGLLVPRRRLDAMADAILRLLRDPGTARAMGEAGRRRAGTLFDIARAVRGVERLYDELLRGHAQRPVA